MVQRMGSEYNLWVALPYATHNEIFIDMIDV
jgi:hypothetical protein